MVDILESRILACRGNINSNTPQGGISSMVIYLTTYFQKTFLGFLFFTPLKGVLNNKELEQNVFSIGFLMHHHISV